MRIMGNKTQSIYNYLYSYDLDPFKDEDLIEGAKTLGMFYYDGVPKQVMDKLFVKFMRKFMMNEFYTSSTDIFRLELINYMHQQESWYTKMFNLYKDLLPYDMLEQVTVQDTDNLSINEQTSVKDHLNTTNVRNSDTKKSDGTVNTTDSDISQFIGNEDSLSEVSDNKIIKSVSSGDSENTNTSLSNENVVSENSELLDTESESVNTNTNNEDVTDTGETILVGTESTNTSGTRNNTLTSTGLTSVEGSQNEKKDEDTNVNSDDSNVDLSKKFTGKGTITSGSINTPVLDPGGSNTIGVDESLITDSESNLSASKNKGSNKTKVLSDNKTTNTESTDISNEDVGIDESSELSSSDKDETQNTTNLSSKTGGSTDRLSGSENSVKSSNSLGETVVSGSSKDVSINNELSDITDSGTSSSSGSISRNNKDTRSKVGNTINNQTDTVVGTSDSNVLGNEVVKDDGQSKLKGRQTTTITGVNEWKPELARKFYQNFVDVDEQWLNNRDCRQLFTMIYS